MFNFVYYIVIFDVKDVRYVIYDYFFIIWLKLIKSWYFRVWYWIEKEFVFNNKFNVLIMGIICILIGISLFKKNSNLF